MAATPDGRGYWLVASDGGIFAFGDAGFYGSTGSLHLDKPIVGMASTLDGQGYWLVASDGGVFAFGDAGFYGSAGGLPLQQTDRRHDGQPERNRLLVGGVRRRIFSFGNVSYFGSTGSESLNAPIVGMDRTADGNGYWLVARDGGVFCFGDSASMDRRVAHPQQASCGNRWDPVSSRRLSERLH